VIPVFSVNTVLYKLRHEIARLPAHVHEAVS
jgi:hypothetical protein